MGENKAAKDDEMVQMGFKVPRWLRRKIRWFVLRRETSMSQETRDFWMERVADEPNGPEGEGE